MNVSASTFAWEPLTPRGVAAFARARLGRLLLVQFIAALLASGTEKSEPPSNPMSADRVRWEHIQRIYEMCNRNVSETARRLNMHRRTLQRILAKRAPR